MTRLRKMMLEELQRRNYSAITTRNYLRVVTEFAKHFGKSPDKLGPNELRTYQAYLLTERKLTPGTRGQPGSGAALLFRQDAQAPSVSRVLAVPPGPAPAADGAQPGGSRAIDRCGRNPVSTDAADDAVRHRHATQRTGSSQGQRHRQPAHDHPRGRRQGRQGSRFASESNPAGNPARVLALAEAQALLCSPRAPVSTDSISRFRTRPSGSHAARPRAAPASANASPRTRCATVGRPTCWRRAPTCAPSRFCSGTAIWRPPPSTCICRSGTCKR